jgi:thioredoxin 2
MSVEASMPTSVMGCPSCGTRNRVANDTAGRPRCSRCHADLPWIVEIGADEFDRVVERSKVPVLVDLWAPWCGPCRVVSPMLAAVAREYAGRIKVVKVNVDENPRLAQEFGASSIPTMVVIKGDRIVDRIVGAIPPNELRMRLFPYLMRTSS